jgi:hypothetical protein
MRKLNLLASTTIGLALATATSAFASTITIQGSDLQNLCTSDCSASGAGSASYSSPSVTLSTGGTASTDTAQITIPNSYSASVGTVALGTLSSMLGGASGLSFDISSGFVSSVSQNAYWVITLGDGTVINSFSDNANGANGFDVGSGVDTSNCSGPSCGSHTFGESWSDFAASLSPTVADEAILSVIVEVGGQGSNYSESIDSITLPGDVTATPLPPTLALFAGGLGVMALLARRRKQKDQAAVA